MATNVLQHTKIDPEFSLGYNLHTAMTRHGKSPWNQVREIWRLRYGPGRLRPEEYYYLLLLLLLLLLLRAVRQPALCLR